MRSPRRKAPSVPASLQRSASASNRRFSLPENWRRLAIATTSGSRRAAASEAVSPVALRAPSATASEEEPNDPFIEDFSNEVMCMSYLYSKLPETGVSPHIGTGGFEVVLYIRKEVIQSGGFDGLECLTVDPGRTTIPLGYTVGLLEGLRPCHMDENAPEAMCLFRLRLPIYPPSQLLQHDGCFCHLTLASL